MVNHNKRLVSKWVPYASNSFGPRQTAQKVIGYDSRMIEKDNARFLLRTANSIPTVPVMIWHIPIYSMVSNTALLYLNTGGVIGVC